jgi:hypothetical protein
MATLRGRTPVVSLPVADDPRLAYRQRLELIFVEEPPSTKAAVSIAVIGSLVGCLGIASASHFANGLFLSVLAACGGIAAVISAVLFNAAVTDENQREDRQIIAAYLALEKDLDDLGARRPAERAFGLAREEIEDLRQRGMARQARRVEALLSQPGHGDGSRVLHGSSR